MKNAIKKCIFVCSVLCSAVFWSSCQDNLEYYDTPDNLKGSIYETLEDRGNYSIFLKGVDLGGYAPILKGKVCGQSWRPMTRRLPHTSSRNTE